MVVSGIVALSSVILPVTLGLFFACGLHPITSRLNRRRWPRALSSLVAVGLVIVVIALVVWLTLRAVVDQWNQIAAAVGEGRATLVDSAADAGVDHATAASVGDELGAFVADVAEVAVRGLVHLAADRGRVRHDGAAQLPRGVLLPEGRGGDVAVDPRADG